MLILREERLEDRSALAALRATWAAEQDPGLVDDPDFEDVYSGWMDANPRKPSPDSRNFYATLGFQPAAELNILRF